MDTYLVDITVEVRAKDSEEAWAKVNKEANSRIGDGIEVVFVDEPMVKEVVPMPVAQETLNDEQI